MKKGCPGHKLVKNSKRYTKRQMKVEPQLPVNG